MDFDMTRTAEASAMEDKYLTFSLLSDTYGIPIQHVTEIINIQSITPVPEMPAYVKGIINLRGNVIPVMDVRLRFNFEPQEYNDRTCIVVVNVNDVTIGLIVDMVKEVSVINKDQVMRPPKGKNSMQSRYINGVGKVADVVILIIDCNCLLAEGIFDSMLSLES